MNCKPGLAIVVRTKGVEYAEKFLGMTFTLVRVNGSAKFGDLWDVVPDRVRPPGVPFAGEPITRVADCILMNIDPDESTEESTEAMRLLTQLPQKEKV